jgi:hypothetical protein
MLKPFGSVGTAMVVIGRPLGRDRYPFPIYGFETDILGVKPLLPKGESVLSY